MEKLLKKYKELCLKILELEPIYESRLYGNGAQLVIEKHYPKDREYKLILECHNEILISMNIYAYGKDEYGLYYRNAKDEYLNDWNIIEKDEYTYAFLIEIIENIQKYINKEKEITINEKFFSFSKQFRECEDIRILRDYQKIEEEIDNIDYIIDTEIRQKQNRDFMRDRENSKNKNNDYNREEYKNNSSSDNDYKRSGFEQSYNDNPQNNVETAYSNSYDSED
jgi:hypothetical protein